MFLGKVDSEDEEQATDAKQHGGNLGLAEMRNHFDELLPFVRSRSEAKERVALLDNDDGSRGRNEAIKNRARDEGIQEAHS